MWLRAHPYDLSFADSLVTSQVRLDNRRGWWLWLHDTSGAIIGVGEVAPWRGFGAGPDEVKREVTSWEASPRGECGQHVLALDGLCSLWRDEAWRRRLCAAEDLQSRLTVLDELTPRVHALAQTPELRSGIELAALDALARSLSVPLCQLLEPRAPLSAPTHIQVKNLAEAIDAARHGFCALKVKVGVSDQWPDELMEIARIRATLPHVAIRLDVNRGWTANQARGALITARAYDVEWVEEPYERLDDYGDRPQVSAPIALDESLSAPHAPPLNELLEATNASIVTLKPMVFGGLTATAHLALRAQKYGAAVCITHTLGSAVERRAAAHLSAALRPNLNVRAGGLGGGLKGDLCDPLPIYGGELRLSTRPGLAVPLTPPQSSYTFSQRVSQGSTDPQTLIHPLEAARGARPHHPALISPHVTPHGELKQIDYDTLYRLTLMITDQLSGQVNQVTPRGSVALSGALSITWVACFHALTGLGVRVTPLRPSLTDDERSRACALAHVEAQVLIEADQILIGMVRHDPRREPTFTPSLRINTATLEGDLNRRVDIAEITLRGWSWERPLITICTSGTSGAPQAISLNARQLCLSAFGSAIRLGHQPDDVWLACLPPYHIGGLSILIRCLLNQTTVQLCAPRDHDIAEAIRTNNVSIVSLTPTLLSSVMDHLSSIDTTTDQSKRRLRALLIGGGPTSRAQWDRARALGLPLKLTWGMSETASQICTQLESHPPDVAIPPLPFVRVKSDEQSRLWVSGPLTMSGVLATGDLGSVNQEGIKVTGRADDVIISGGINVSPTEVEEVLNAHPDILESAVIGRSHPEYGSRPVAFLVADEIALSDRQSPDVLERRPAHEDISTWCRAHLSNYKVPDVFIWVNALPRGPLGKLQRASLRQSAAQELSRALPTYDKREDQ